MVEGEYEVLLYKTDSQKPVEEVIRKLPKSTSAKLFRLFDLLSKYGTSVGMPYVKKVRGKLWEVRVRGTIEVRCLFVQKDSKIIILHCFKKKQSAIPTKEIVIAQRRLK